jgi:hypothetical protein
MPIKYSQKSLYYSTPQNSFALGYYVPRPIPPDNSDTWIKLAKRHINKPTVLSYDLYGTPAYWWIFNVLNPDVIKDPIRDFQEGVIIKVPTLQRLQQVIG